MNRFTLTGRSICHLVFVAAFLFPYILLGGTEAYDPKSFDTSKENPPIDKSWCETPAPLEVRISLPGWFAGLSGETGARGITNSVNVDFHELLSHLTHVPIVLGAEFRYQRWEFFGDGLHQEVGAHVTLPGLAFTDANIHIKTALVEAFVGYRLINCEKGSLSFFAGARYNYEEIHLSIFDNGDARLPILRQLLGLGRKLNASGSIDWVDPVIGLRGRWKIWKAVTLYAEGDVGGFDVNGDPAFETRRQGNTIVQTPVSSSDWSYQVQGGVELQLTRRIWSQIGWRYLKYDYVSGGFTNKTSLNGPFIQTGINF